jgi:adenylyltransferase/sulfurtransferase
VDFDEVEPSNLSRSILFRMSDAADHAPKAKIAARRVAQVHPYAGAHIYYFHGDLVWDLGSGVYRYMDVVLGCLDNVEARRLVNIYCWKAQKPWIDGAMHRLAGSVAFYDATDEHACYECGITERLRQMANDRYSCIGGVVRSHIQSGHEPTTQATSAIIAALQSQEAIKLCHQHAIPGGMKLFYNGHLHNFDLEDPSVTTLTSLARSPGCFCHQEDRFTDVTVLAVTSANTAQDVLEMAQDLFQMQQPSLLFGTFHPSAQGRRFIVRTQCHACGYTRDIQRAAHRVRDVDVRCPVCHPAVSEVTATKEEDELEMQMEAIYRIEYNDTFSTFTLAELGLPEMDIVKIVDIDGHTKYVQVGNNLMSVFRHVET